MFGGETKIINCVASLCYYYMNIKKICDYAMTEGSFIIICQYSNRKQEACVILNIRSCLSRSLLVMKIVKVLLRTDCVVPLKIDLNHNFDVS